MHSAWTRFPLDPTFDPVIAADRAYRNAAAQDPHRAPIAIAVSRPDGSISRVDSAVVGAVHPMAGKSQQTVKRIIKRLLWERGGSHLILAGPDNLTGSVVRDYMPKGARSFDAEIMARIYNRTMTVETMELDRVPEARETSQRLGGHLDGCRIGFDLGASDWKIAAVIDGEAVFTDETPWDPSSQADPAYHDRILSEGLARAAKHLPRVDAIGGSAAGVYVDNRVRVASLFRGVAHEDWPQVESLFVRLQETWKVPMAIVNDGDVAALGGALSLGRRSLLGLALGSSEACGYIDPRGNLTGWLNELAFVPIDLQPDAPVDDWSKDQGCGAQYLSQQGVLRLAERAGLRLDPQASRAERLVFVQDALERGDPRAEEVFRTVGGHLGAALAQYADTYEMETVIIMGRVTSGNGGRIILETASHLLSDAFPDVHERIDLRLPDEASRRIGQAVAAASLPAIAEAA